MSGQPVTAPDQCSPPAATDQLAAREQASTCGPCGPWPQTCEDIECPEFPVGAVIAADEDLWLAVLEMPPAHVLE